MRSPIPTRLVKRLYESLTLAVMLAAGALTVAWVVFLGYAAWKILI